MPKKMLTLADLAQYCEQNHLYAFRATDPESQLVVAAPATYEKDDESSTDSILYGKVKLLHTNRNRNGSNVTEAAARACMPGIQYKPLLANFCEIDGVKDFTSHDMEFNDDGSVTYIEHQVGCFTADEPTMEFDEDTQRYYIYANVAIPREYTDAAEIIERKGGTKISAELLVNAMSYDAKTKELLLEDIEVLGATCLGKNPNTGEDVQEGMEGARLDIADFSIKNTAMFNTDSKLIEVLEKLNTTLSGFDIAGRKTGEENLEKGGTPMEMEQEIVLESEPEVTPAEPTQEPEVQPEGEPEVEPEAQPEGEAEPAQEPEAEGEPEVPAVETNAVHYSVTIGETVREFSLSLSDIIYSLQDLVNATYSESDNCWYSVEVYAEDNTVVMHDWWSNKAYRQNYKQEDDTFSLVGDRVEVFTQWLTSDEMTKLDEMRKNYDLATERLAKYEAEPEKAGILAQECYAKIADTAEFKALMEDHFDLSVEEVTNKADEILLNAAKGGAITFEAAAPEQVVKPEAKKLPEISKKVSRYGNLFAKKN